MKANEVMKLLRISRPTLHRYIKNGSIKYIEMPNKQYNYDEEDVYKLLNKDVPRKTYVYARVSTQKQKNNLDNQIQMLKNWAFNYGYNINGVFADVASGISFNRRKEFFELLDEILDHKVGKVIIAYKDSISRVGFELFYYLFQHFGTEIIVVSEVGSEKLDAEDIFEEIVSLLHCYSMKLYSKRRNQKIEIGVKNANH